MKSSWKRLKDVPEDELIKAIQEGTSYSNVLSKVGCNPDNYRYYKKIREFCDDKGLSYDNLLKLNKDRYYENPKKCKKCGKIIPYEKRSNDFCNSSCAASYNDKIYVKRKKIEGVKRYRSGAPVKSGPKSRKNHNKLLDTKYKDLNIPHINDGCCPICGQPNCTSQFCKDHNFQLLISLVKKLNLDPATIGTTKIFSEYERVRNELCDLYWNQGKSTVEISEIYDGLKDSSSVFYTMEKLGIPRRTRSESLINSYLTGRSEIGTNDNLFRDRLKSSHHITWENTTVFLRSSYEVDYAKQLDSLKIRYSVESLRIGYYDSVLEKDRVAVPDFYLPDTNEIVEIKSDFTLDIQEMLDKFDAYKKLGYIPKLILEHEEIDLYNIENLISSSRLERIKTQNLKILFKVR